MIRTLGLSRALYDILLSEMRDGNCSENPQEISDIIYAFDDQGEPIPDLRFTIRGLEKDEDIVGDVPVYAQLYREGRWSQEIEITPARGILDICPETGKLEECGEAVARNVTEQEADDIIGYLHCSG